MTSVIVLTMGVFIVILIIIKIVNLREQATLDDVQFSQWVEQEYGTFPLDPEDVPEEMWGSDRWYPWGKAGKIKFNNNHTASIIRHAGSYGGQSGLYEMAMYKLINGKWDMVYTHPFQNDVEGYMAEDDVNHFLKEIQKLEHIRWMT